MECLRECERNDEAARCRAPMLGTRTPPNATRNPGSEPCHTIISRHHLSPLSIILPRYPLSLAPSLLGLRTFSYAFGLLALPFPFPDPWLCPCPCPCPPPCFLTGLADPSSPLSLSLLESLELSSLDSSIPLGAWYMQQTISC